jgi:MFS family permease
MSGLLLGILLARTVAGWPAEAGSWRLVYFVAAAAMLVQALVLARTLPRARPPAGHLGYGEPLRSIPAIVREEPVLRLRALFGALSMGAFSVLWTSIAFLLAGPPYHYGTGTIGLFGLAGGAQPHQLGLYDELLRGRGDRLRRRGGCVGRGRLERGQPRRGGVRRRVGAGMGDQPSTSRSVSAAARSMSSATSAADWRQLPST